MKQLLIIAAAIYFFIQPKTAKAQELSQVQLQNQINPTVEIAPELPFEPYYECKSTNVQTKTIYTVTSKETGLISVANQAHRKCIQDSGIDATTARATNLCTNPSTRDSLCNWIMEAIH